MDYFLEETKQHVIDYCRDIETRENPRFRLSGVSIDEIIEHNREHPKYSEERTRKVIADLIRDGLLKQWGTALFAGANWPFTVETP